MAVRVSAFISDLGLGGGITIILTMVRMTPIILHTPISPITRTAIRRRSLFLSLPPQETRTSPDDSRHDLKFLNRQIARARDQADFEYQDGDISRAEHDREIRRLYEIKKSIRDEAKVNGGTLTGDQENEWLQLLRSGGEVSESSSPSAPEVSGHDLKKVTDEIHRTHLLMDQKLKEGNITKAQYDGLSDYLARTEKHAQADASENDGTLSPDEENTILQQLHARQRFSFQKPHRQLEKRPFGFLIQYRPR